jgi:exodeoxyribonuclease V alpha subunit
MKKINIEALYNREIFRDVDIALARLLTRLAPDDPPGVRLAALLASRASSEGHVCIDLHQWARQTIRGPDGRSTMMQCPDTEDWIDQLRSSAMVSGSAANCPLVCDARGRVYLQRLYQHEQQLAQLLRKRAIASGPEIAQESQEQIGTWLNHYFGNPQVDAAPDWQKIAAAVSLAKRLCIISGAPGTGKTTTVAKILAVLMELNRDSTLRIHLCAPTGKAAARLGDSLSQTCQTMDCPTEIAATMGALEACTIHRLLKMQSGNRGFLFRENNPLPTDVVVVDEASMVDLVLMNRLVQAIPQAARLIILGDKDQLASVEAGSVFGDLCGDLPVQRYSKPMRNLIFSVAQEKLSRDFDSRNDEIGLQDCIVELQKNYRFENKEGISALTQAVNRGNSKQINLIFGENRGVAIRWDKLRRGPELYKTLAAYALKGYENYLTCTGPEEALSRFSHFMILCALAKGPFGVERLNQIVTDQLQKARLIGSARPWYKGRPVMITRNNYRIGLFNGDMGLVWPDSDGTLSVWFQGEGGALRAFRPQRLPEHQTVFAMTVHKSQGSEFERALLLLPDKDAPVLSRELIYTGCSRARKQLVMIACEDVLDKAVSRRIQRASGLYDALWREPIVNT